MLDSDFDDDNSVQFTGGTKNFSIFKQNINMHFFQILSGSAFSYSLVVNPSRKIGKKFIFKLCLSWEKFSVLPVNWNSLSEHYFRYKLDLSKYNEMPVSKGSYYHHILTENVKKKISGPCQDINMYENVE